MIEGNKVKYKEEFFIDNFNHKLQTSICEGCNHNQHCQHNFVMLLTKKEIENGVYS